MRSPAWIVASVHGYHPTLSGGIQLFAGRRANPILEGMIVELLLIAAAVVGYILLQAVILPRRGVPT